MHYSPITGRFFPHLLALALAITTAGCASQGSFDNQQSNVPPIKIIVDFENLIDAGGGNEILRPVLKSKNGDSLRVVIENVSPQVQEVDFNPTTVGLEIADEAGRIEYSGTPATGSSFDNYRLIRPKEAVVYEMPYDKKERAISLGPDKFVPIAFPAPGERRTVTIRVKFRAWDAAAQKEESVASEPYTVTLYNNDNT